MNTDILIIGTGCSGLYCALHLPEDKRITIITKSDIESSDSFLAQGGICVLRDEEDYDAFMEDTLKAGHYENDKESVSIMIRSSRDVIGDLVNYGVDFARDDAGNFIYTREGAHSRPRILFHHDITGKEITVKLLEQVKKRDNITILEHTTLLDIVVKDGTCCGGVLAMEDGAVKTVSAAYTVLATGGIGGLYQHSTNFKHLTGDALAISIKHGVRLKNMDYIQFHPTTLYTENATDRLFLISESVRGEGARLYNKDMKPFVNELLPRDVVAGAIREQMKKDGTDFVWEDLRPIPEAEIKDHFPNIAQHCAEQNYDVTKECIPVVPAQHYFMGGIWVDHNSKTSMEGLYAIGETACNGVHGKNRLASNSLLESLVFAKRAAGDIKANPREPMPVPVIDLFRYSDREALENEYRNLVINRIEQETNQKKENEHV